jgi:hypothetical protein
MKSASWRHHYLPEFYLQGFTDESGKFKIYDVEKEYLVKDGKDFSPRSYFFDSHANTIDGVYGPDDFLERKFYSKLDNDIAKLFAKIRNNSASTDFGLTDNDMPALQHFIATMYWRIPANYDKVAHLIEHRDLNQLGLVLENSSGERIKDNELERRLKNDPGFFKMIKFWFPLVTYLRILKCNKPLTIQTVSDKFPTFCSDNPVIFLNSSYPDIYIDDFIFPLTKTHYFIRSNKINSVPNTVKIEIDLILLYQAKKYACCTDYNYISMLKSCFIQNYKSLDKLKQKVFQDLFG